MKHRIKKILTTPLDLIYEKYHLKRYLRARYVLAMDVAASVVSSFVALLLAKYLFAPAPISITIVVWWLSASFVFSTLFFFLFNSFRAIIRHASLASLGRLGAAVVCKAICIDILLRVLPSVDFSLHYLGATILDLLITSVVLCAIRVVMIITYRYMVSQKELVKESKRVLIYGSSTGDISLLGVVDSMPKYTGVGILFFESNKSGLAVDNVPFFVYKDFESFVAIKNKLRVDALLFPSEEALRKEQDKLVDYCIKSDVKIFIAPKIDEVKGGKIGMRNIREIIIEDLLGRDEIKISLKEVSEFVDDKVVMVTGAAGSIGSEICRQLAHFGVKRLVLLDNAETPMHNFSLELKQRFPQLDFVPYIGDVRSLPRLDHVFRTYKPQVVFHAAAYKHVPLMEDNPCEAVLVNVTGTRQVADKCIEYGVEKMVMISTDKAVNPTNVMGCSKRLAEIYVQSLRTKTKFVTTRFGNVLGSNGSVIPLFRKQIAEGGPLTVTHKDITRFFMTIPEACRLVLEAATLSDGGDIFVFDMGEAVKIDTLARRMIHLAGFEPDKEIKIVYTGLRPGEKLYEEVLASTENTIPTSHQSIRIAKVREYDYQEAVAAVNDLTHLAKNVEITDLVRLMKQVVKEYKSENSKFEALDKENK